MRFVILLLLGSLGLVACSRGSSEGGPGPALTVRCEADLAATGLFSSVGNTARAHVLGASDPLIGGQSADGRPGDVLLENENLQVIISQPGRHFGAIPFGGWIVDAALKRSSGAAGDQFGRMGLLYAFGRTINATDVEILSDGTAGGPAIVAVTGPDALNDFIHLQTAVGQFLSNAQLAIDPEQPRSIKATTYYVLSPGESRVRVFTQFCNEGPEPVSFPLGEVIDQGGSTEFFNPNGCSVPLSSTGCEIDSTRGFGFQGDGVAYGYRSYRTDNLAVVSSDALLQLGGAVGILTGAENASGLLAWLNPQLERRPGTFAIKAGERRAFLRDFFVVRDLAELTSTFLFLDGAQKGHLEVNLQYPGGAPAPGARVGVLGAGNRLVTLLVADEHGRAQVYLPPGTYSAQAGLVGHVLEPAESVQIGTSGDTERTFVLGERRTLTVKIQDPFGAPMPGKVTVLCPSGVCPTPMARYGQLFGLEKHPSNVAAVGFVPPQGALALKLAPGAYEIVVTRGPEFSAFPDAWPLRGEPVDLTSTDQSVVATLARVVNTEGWISADLHVHAANSADSSVANETRVMSFLAEGVDLLVSTDHDVLTDYAPVIASLGAQGFITSMVGSEVSTFDYGHFNAFPMVFRNEVHGGPFDWAGGAEGATMRPTQLFAGIREEHPGSVLQLNHGRGQNGALTQLRVDTDTFATHADPTSMRMLPAPDATATDTRLLDANFDAFEVANGPAPSDALLNDWMTMLSTGRPRTGTAVSDTHYAFSAPAGYSRTYVDVGSADRPGQFEPGAFASSVRAMRAIGTNGPFIRLTARRLLGGITPDGSSVGIGETISIGAGDAIELTVDVQAPEWMRFDRLELYTHADGREALDGQSNTDKPESRVHQTIPLDPTSLIEPVPDTNGLLFRRIHLVQTFRDQPTEDTWYVVLLRSGAAATLYPLGYGVTCVGAVCTATAEKPYAFTNPIFVDADGSGAYDNFPQKARSIRAPERRTPTEPGRGATIEELETAIHRALEHSHQ
jgi:hypothetical protein